MVPFNFLFLGIMQPTLPIADWLLILSVGLASPQVVTLNRCRVFMSLSAEQDSRFVMKRGIHWFRMLEIVRGEIHEIMDRLSRQVFGIASPKIMAARNTFHHFGKMHILSASCFLRICQDWYADNQPSDNSCLWDVKRHEMLLDFS